jgi:hypothetical protein
VGVEVLADQGRLTALGAGHGGGRRCCHSSRGGVHYYCARTNLKQPYGIL